MSILDTYYRINQLAGINIHISQDGTVSVNACGLIASGKQLDIAKKISDLSSIDDLKKHFPPKFPLALNISGKGVLYRQIEKIDEIEQNNFNKVLPNANIEDFYVQNFVSGNQSFVSVIRKADADRWINLLTEQGFEPLALSLGPFVVSHVISQLNVYGDELIFNGNIVHRDKQTHWTGFRYDESALAPYALKIESEAINEKILTAYAAAFQLILASNFQLIQAQVPSLDAGFKKKIADNKIKVKGFVIISIFFVLLLVNFILLSWLNSANGDLGSRVSILNQSTTNKQDINEQVKKKEGLLQTLGWDGEVNKSALIDQLASLMPTEITLNEISVNPLDLNSSRTQKTPVFFDHRIRITGFSDKIIAVNEWMARIKTKAWVKNIQIENYSFNNEMNTGQFSIILDH